MFHTEWCLLLVVFRAHPQERAMSFPSGPHICTTTEFTMNGWACSRWGTGFTVAGAGGESSTLFLLGLGYGVHPGMLSHECQLCSSHLSVCCFLLALSKDKNVCLDVLLGMKWKFDGWVFLGIWVNSFVMNPAWCAHVLPPLLESTDSGCLNGKFFLGSQWDAITFINGKKTLLYVSGFVF